MSNDGNCNTFTQQDSYHSDSGMKCQGSPLHYRHQPSVLNRTLDAIGKFHPAQDTVVTSCAARDVIGN